MKPVALEIQSEIISYLNARGDDLHTAYAAILVSRFWSRDAKKILYRSPFSALHLSISADDYDWRLTQILDNLEDGESGNRLCGYVEYLDLPKVCLDNPEESSELDRMCPHEIIRIKLCSAVRGFVNLRAIRLEARRFFFPESVDAIATLLCPNLESVILSVDWMEHLGHFLRLHPHIAEIEVLPKGAFFLPYDEMQGILPNLNSITGNCDTIASLVTNRPVHTVCCGGMIKFKEIYSRTRVVFSNGVRSEEDIDIPAVSIPLPCLSPGFIANLSASSVALTRLSIKCSAPSSMNVVIELAQHFPSLESLSIERKITLSSPSSGDPVARPKHGFPGLDVNIDPTRFLHADDWKGRNGPSFLPRLRSLSFLVSMRYSEVGYRDYKRFDVTRNLLSTHGVHDQHLMEKEAEACSTLQLWFPRLEEVVCGPFQREWSRSGIDWSPGRCLAEKPTKAEVWTPY